ncbi:uncharacterized protein AMSG_01437 [Thecamonas trahens ATCC 50062]|uniref:SH3 domain-containing protein n=1 Tax=Thecamonas trahens ATCC 50062 TaxID=461836 RepID=A0A0L0DRG4_THETB|nr:hypothetical protein AMSG_01437 [Thecamonas trahens ATCC 50062]KNC54581.1 hypothetical protein AMSG_01437 [Thecamonas trahens ATCC 50062]|eukprot:XP_013761490.1 hypothetical protein AMSG_01437 [Thecamonas trahens ATCC 50062]
MQCMGGRLEDTLAAEGGALPALVFACVTFLADAGIYTDGIFRVSASASDIAELKTALESQTSAGDALVIPTDTEAAAVAALLKEYLRELPEPIVADHLFEVFMGVVEDEEYALDEERMFKVLLLLDPPRKSLMAVLMGLLHEISTYANINRMTASNLAAVMAPNILRRKGMAPLEEAERSSTAIKFMSFAIEHAPALIAKLAPDGVSDFAFITRSRNPLALMSDSSDDDTAGMLGTSAAALELAIGTGGAVTRATRSRTYTDSSGLLATSSDDDGLLTPAGPMPNLSSSSSGNSSSPGAAALSPANAVVVLVSSSDNDDDGLASSVAAPAASHGSPEKPIVIHAGTEEPVPVAAPTSAPQPELEPVVADAAAGDESSSGDLVESPVRPYATLPPATTAPSSDAELADLRKQLKLACAENQAQARQHADELKRVHANYAHDLEVLRTHLREAEAKAEEASLTVTPLHQETVAVMQAEIRSLSEKLAAAGVNPKSGNPELCMRMLPPIAPQALTTDDNEPLRAHVWASFASFTDSDELLNIREGDELDVLSTEGNWWLARSRATGATGLVPSNHVVIDLENLVQRRREATESDASSGPAPTTAEQADPDADPTPTEQADSALAPAEQADPDTAPTTAEQADTDTAEQVDSAPAPADDADPSPDTAPAPAKQADTDTAAALKASQDAHKTAAARAQEFAGKLIGSQAQIEELTSELDAARARMAEMQVTIRRLIEQMPAAVHQYTRVFRELDSSIDTSLEDSMHRSRSMSRSPSPPAAAAPRGVTSAAAAVPSGPRTPEQILSAYRADRAKRDVASAVHS